VTDTAGRIVSVNDFVAVLEWASVIVNLTLGALTAVGVPEITPAPDRVSPPGRPVAAHEYGPVPSVPAKLAL
jgi:hypothetical protein